MTRLPIPGQDNGSWGSILNEFLAQAHEDSGALKPGIVGSTQIQSGAIQASHLADNSIVASKFASGALNGAVSDASTSSKGTIQLAGDLAGTGTAAATPRVSNLQQVLEYTAGSYPARPSTSRSVIWQGPSSADPAVVGGAINGDIWRAY
jgi:hypothetical protein